ncbi:MAG: peptidyl-dipeptidase [Actinomycetota bacterium]|jgi:peptidyl-dipeptidase A|nr:peptidyl-dipeptidase [Actinomycetota bacterium]
MRVTPAATRLPPMPVAPHTLVEELESKFQRLETDFHRAYWESQIDATPEKGQQRAELELELRRVKGDPAALTAVRAALEQQLHDPILRRQLEVLRLSLLGNQMTEEQRTEIVELSSAVEGDFASFRPVVDGQALSDNEIEEVLATSNDVELRKRTWEASKEIGDVVAERIRELARARNRAAHDAGFADYYRMSLEMQEMSEEWLFDTLDEVEELTEKPFRHWKSQLDDSLKKRFGVGEIYPWHYSDPFFQSVPPEAKISLDEELKGTDARELAEKTFAGWGIDLSKVLENSDLYPRERKCQHAFCLDIDRSAQDVRILANIVPGERWVEVTLHECGHAAYDVMIRRQIPYLLRRAAHTFVTEAIALLCGRLLRDVGWLVEVAGVEASRVDAKAARLRASNAGQSLMFARWVLVMAHFERLLYSDPEGDLDAEWWSLVQRLQLVTPPPGRTAPDWAAKIHIAVSPVYYHNYLLGEILASQLTSIIDAQCGGLAGVRDAGELLIDRVFKPGSVLRWDSLIEEAIGAPFSPRDFVAGLAL